MAAADMNLEDLKQATLSKVKLLKIKNEFDIFDIQGVSKKRKL